MSRSRLLAVCAAMLFWGCEGESPSEPPGAGGAAGGGSGGEAGDPGGCRSDFECAEAEVCISGACEPGDCNLERTCPAGEVCDAETRACVPEGMAGCEATDDCRGEGFCIDGACVDVQCVEDVDCDPGEECSDQNRCVPQLETCVDGDDDGYGIGADCLGIDCDDGNPDINPGVQEDGQTRCDDGVDDNCSGSDSVCGERDADGDGWTDRGGDCDDGNPNINPDQVETPYNRQDDDCDPETSDGDLDGDGYDSVMVGGDDCDDMAPNSNPGAREIPGNGIDEDCDGVDRMPSNEDRDGDGFSEQDGDCNDDDPAVNPEAVEVVYNGKDDDCNRDTPDNDLDNDGFPAPNDCADDDPRVNPGAEERYYNGRDDDCDPSTVDDDQDGDGFAGNGGPDCNDESAAINPSIPEENYNGVDDDCDPSSPDDDLDNDGFIRADDCDDSDPRRNPAVPENANENCDDGIDNDCRGGDVVCDPDAVDSDGDGVPDGQDCEPNNGDIPGPAEIEGNGLDDDCDPQTPDVAAPCDDDAFDRMGNDTPETAIGVEDGNTTGVQYGDLYLCPGDDDWYRIDIGEGDGLEVDIAFDHDASDLDLRLFRANPGGEPVFVDSSLGLRDTETVYVRRAPAAGTYLVRVSGVRNIEGAYRMTVNVFDDCVDDADGLDGEQNDIPEDAASFPPVDEVRQVCDYDDDWYRFTLADQRNVRIDLLFTDADGDIDLELFDDGGRRIARSASVDDNESIEEELGPGTYRVRVFGFSGARNNYSLFRTTGETDTIEVDWEMDLAVPDFAGGVPGVAEVELPVDAPPGAIISNITLRVLDVDHTWLEDLVITALWDDEPYVVLWNRDGENGRDGGLDDDFEDVPLNPLANNDITLEDRRLREFAGLPANGTFTMRVEDRAPADTGTITEVRITVEYLVP